MEPNTQSTTPDTLGLLTRLGQITLLCLATWGFLYFVQCWVELYLFLNRSW